MLDSYIMDNTPAAVRELYSGLPAYAQQHTFGALDEDVVVLDTETTGLSFNHDELIQIAAARMSKGEITEWYVTFVNPGIPIPEEIEHLTHISQAEVDEAPTPDEALQALVEFVGASPVVAHNANFDYTFCTKREAGAALKNNMWIDSLELARITVPRMRSHRLLDLIRAFGGPESTHRADDDVAATCVLLRILLAAVDQMDESLVRFIAEMCPAEEWNTGYVFQLFANPEAPEYNFRNARQQAVGALTKNPLRTDAHDLLPPTCVSQETAGGEGDSANAEGLDPEALPVPATLEFATEDELTAAFAPKGLLGTLYPNYEQREEQLEMSLAVNKAFSTSTNLVVEAGTGVGKSMAYLLPAAQMAKRNNITVGVATKTNALLDQLVHKELPLLAEALDITYAPLKGFTHYLCNRKVQQLAERPPQIIEVRNQAVNQAPALAALLAYVSQTEYDDMDGLKMDFRAYPRWNVSTKSRECLRRKCPFFGRGCYVHGAREQAARSDVVVTNHSLLFLDQAFDQGLFPQRIRYWVVDEAHGAEAEARKAASVTVASENIRNLVRRTSDGSVRYNVFTRALRNKNVAAEAKNLFESLVNKAQVAGGAFAMAAGEYCLTVKDLLYYDAEKRNKGYEYLDLWLSDEVRAGEAFAKVKSTAKSVMDALEDLIKATRDIVFYLEEVETTSREQRDVALVALELRELYEALDATFFHNSENKVYSVRLNKKKDRLNDVFTIQPMDVGHVLNETLYQTTSAVVYTSATLTVDGSFDQFNAALGLNTSEDSRCNTLQVESSFNFDEHMRVYIPTNMPEPQDAAYLPTLQTFLAQLHQARQGSLLTLFTNRREMEQSFEVVREAIKEDDLRVVCQKWGVSPKGLRDEFLADEHLSLFALRSFWEGFDAPGSTLKGVVIPKLPFGLPTDPLSCERALHDSRAWAHYSLPAAVIDVKQAVGRLIRTATDTGFVVLADQRLISKYYGKKFINSLPSKNVAMLPMEQIVEEVRATRVAEQEGSA